MKVCKVCFKSIESEFFINDMFNIKEHTLCYECFQKMELLRKNIKVQDIKIYVLMKYNNFIRELIYKFKGLFDIELRTIFIEYFIAELEDKYWGYTISFAPSFIEDDKKRGFNHIQEIFSFWRWKKINCFLKKENIKQSSQSFSNRNSIKDIIDVNAHLLRGIKKLLIVDDIFTSGNTLLSCYEKAKEQGVKKIKLLAICQAHFNNVE